MEDINLKFKETVYGNNDILEKLKNYFATTPREQVLKDWADAKENSPKGGVGVREFMDINKELRVFLESSGLNPNAEGLYDGIGFADFKSWSELQCKQSNTLYGFYYCPCIHESASALISLHRTEKGAQVAMEFHKETARKEHEDDCKWSLEERGYPWAHEFGESERWFVDKIEIRD